MSSFIRDKAGEEKGMALVIVLVVMLLMAVLGTMLFTVSSTEIKISRNKKFRDEAFFAAERANEYAQTDAGIYTAIGSGSIYVPLTGISLASGGSDASGTVQYLATGNPPRGSGVDITDFKANYFHVDVTGTAPANATVRIESSAAKIVPNE
jgi:type II secretory pathway pseudopilin PulG